MLFKRDHGINKAFTLAPSKYKVTWALEAEKFGLDVPVHVFESSHRSAFERWAKENPSGMVVSHYEALTSDANMRLFSDWIDDRTFFGADESVHIKNRNSGFFKRALDLSKDAAVTRALSGKPTPQGVHDLWSQLRFCRALNGFNFFQFRNKFGITGGFQGRQIVGVKNAHDLDIIRFNHSFFARRPDWGTSIDTDYQQLKLTLLKDQQDAYKHMEDEFILWLNNDIEVSADQVITKHMKLQQISSGFIYDEFKKAHWIIPFTITPKYLDLLEFLRTELVGKAIIIFHYAPTGDMLFNHLREFHPAIIRGNKAMHLEGRTTDGEKDRFNNDPQCRILLGQMKAIKYGHTLMGNDDDPCLTTIYFENTYSLDDRAQSEERNQGEGQKAAINVRDYITSSIEGRIISALTRKEQVAGEIMGYYKRKAEQRSNGMTNRDSEMTNVRVLDFKHETQKGEPKAGARLFEIEGMAMGEPIEVWIPKSISEWNEEDSIIQVPEWFAKKNDLL